MRTPLIAAVLLCLLNVVSASDQSSSTQTAPSPAASSVTESVAIYITAATNKGVPLTDLKPDDLRITEDKVEAKIEKIRCGKPDPILLGVLVDVSGSQRDAHLASRYDALQAFLNQVLREQDGAFVVAYDDKPYKLSQLSADRASLLAAFDELKKHQPHGPTALYDAIKAAANANFFDRSGRRILVVVGDWEDNSSHIRLDQVGEFPERTSTTVYAVVDSTASAALSTKSYKHALLAAKEVTEETGGLYYDVHGEKEFVTALQAIQVAISGSCRVDYSIPKVASPKKGIKLHVEANSKGTSIHYAKVRFAVAE
jgi:VWFA-related protein